MSFDILKFPNGPSQGTRYFTRTTANITRGELVYVVPPDPTQLTAINALGIGTLQVGDVYPARGDAPGAGVRSTTAVWGIAATSRTGSATVSEVWVFDDTNLIFKAPWRMVGTATTVTGPGPFVITDVDNVGLTNLIDDENWPATPGAGQMFDPSRLVGSRIVVASCASPGTAGTADRYVVGSVRTISAAAFEATGTDSLQLTLLPAATGADWVTGDSYYLHPGSGFIGLPISTTAATYASGTAAGDFLNIGDGTFTTTAPFRIVGVGPDPVPVGGEHYFEVVLNHSRDSQSA